MSRTVNRAQARKPQAPRKQYQIETHDFQKIGHLGAVENQSWSKIPTYYYDVQQHQFPLTQTEFDTDYADTINVFDPSDNVPGHQSNATSASGVNEPFLAMGVGVVAICEGLSFTIPGRLVTTPASPTCAPIVDGCPTGNDRDATLWYGGALWNFVEKFFQAFRLQVAVNHRFLIVDESLFDVGMTPTPPEFVGASSSLCPAMPFIREVNDVMDDKAFGKNFLPQNLAGTDCPGAPTAAVTYGHPRIIGLANRIYCFNRPIPILPGMRFDTSFVRVENDNSFLAAMERMGVLDPATATTPSAGVTDVAICNDSGAFPSSFHVPGGTLSLGLVFKGYALQPRACVEYVAQYMAGGLAPMADALAGNPYLTNLLLQGVKGANLAGAAPGSLAGVSQDAIDIADLVKKIDPDVLKRLTSG